MKFKILHVLSKLEDIQFVLKIESKNLIQYEVLQGEVELVNSAEISDLDLFTVIPLYYVDCP